MPSDGFRTSPPVLPCKRDSGQETELLPGTDIERKNHKSLLIHSYHSVVTTRVAEGRFHCVRAEDGAARHLGWDGERILPAGHRLAAAGSSTGRRGR